MEEATQVEPAILVRGLSKQYGNENMVLDDLDMTVIKGTIYGLLGASGCGKTTLLSSILGSRKIQSGSISILSQPPGVVPVKSIGYMPQDIALVGEFSVKNVFQHQGWIFGMTDKQIEERHKFFETLLNLPPANKLIKNLSGGQQRRVSLAVVLIQDPELLILDEPTVGLDPVLRQNLWDYLVKITAEEKKTVVLTTHYIEEAKQANMVGMLRHGKMLAEGEPQNLMNEFNCNSLENLFISLSEKQEERDPSITKKQNRFISKFDELKILNQKAPKKSLSEKICFTNRGHTKALMSKNFIRYVRHPGTLIISLIFPLVQMSTVFLAIGGIPDDLKIGIVNQELGSYRNCEDYVNDNKTVGGLFVDNRTCEYKALGCKFTEQIQKFIRNQVYFESVEKALIAVKEEKIHQVLFFPHNYSAAFSIFTDASRGGSDDPEDFSYSQIVVYRDEIDYTLGVYIEKEIYNSYLKFAEELASDCHWSKRFAKVPMVFNEPIYGKADLTFTDLIAPGMMAILALALPEALSLLTFITEKNGGVWERTIISGIKPAEILMSYIITFGLISVVQIVECFLFSYYVFGFECRGNILHALLLLYLLALVGVTIGILLSAISKNETEAIYGAIGISFPFFLLTGFFWPLEGMPTYLQHISYALPPTIPIEALNNIIFRGWDISNFNVYKGYLTSSGYIFLFIVLNVMALKFEKK